MIYRESQLSQKDLSQRSVVVGDTGCKTEIVFNVSDLIGEGKYGDIYRIYPEVVRQEDKRSAGVFVLKKFHEHTLLKHPDIAQHNLGNFSLIKRSGMRTWRTFRMLQDGSGIIMSDGEGMGSEMGVTRVISRNKSESSLFYEKNPIQRLLGFEDAVEDAIQDIEIASQRKIVLPEDVWFYFFREHEHEHLLADIFLGDLDEVSVEGDAERSIKSIRTLNLDNLARSVGFAILRSSGGIPKILEEGESSRLSRILPSIIMKHF